MPASDAILGMVPLASRYNLQSQAEALSVGLQGNGRQLVEKAVQFAEHAHCHQKRYSGQPYITHPLAVAMKLVEYQQPPAVISAAILHATVEDCDVGLETIAETFGEEVSFLVDGMTKIVRDGNTDTSATLSKILKYADKDPRLVLLGALPEQCAFIDDKIENVESAKTLGINGIQYTTLAQLRRELQKLDIETLEQVSTWK